MHPSVSTPTGPFIWPEKIGPFKAKRLPVILIMIALAAYPGELGELTRGLMTDAYVQVSAFVATTLMIFYGAERIFKFNLGSALKNSKGWQVPLSAVLGATPGCGGAVVVVAAYSSGNAGFGAVVAALTATMGDAAFLLIATRPDVAMVVLPTSLAVGVISGIIVDRFNKIDYRGVAAATCELAPLIGRIRPKDYIYVALVVPGLVMGISQLALVNLVAVYGDWMLLVGMLGTAIGLWVWSTSPVQAMTNVNDEPFTRVT
ncbi:MAG: putative manganese transporter, partial [Paracoccaceae bacterium]